MSSWRRDVDQLDLGRLVEDAVGHGLAHLHARDAGDDVVQALEVLDVDRGVDIDPGRQQLLDVLVALGVAAAGCIGVGQLVDQRHLRPARKQCVEVHLLQHPAHVGHLTAGKDLEALEQGLGLLAAMGLDDPDYDIDAPAGASACASCSIS